MEFKDYYKILGVDPDADDKEIKAAYRKLARKYHPDVSAEDDAEANFKEVSEAYEVLRDKEKRAEFDAIRQYGGAQFEPPPGWQPRGEGDFKGEFHGGFSDFFEQVFGAGGHGSRQGYSRREFSQRGEDIEYRVAIFLEDAWRGTRQQISYEVPYFDEQRRLRRRKKTLNVKIPAGVTPGERIRLKGQGAPGIGDAPDGDLFLEIRFAPHPLYEVEGRNLLLTVPVAPWEAALGTRARVPTLDGHINLTIPAGSQSGKRLRIKGRGLGKEGHRGDLIAVLAVVMPDRVSEEERGLWQQLAATSAFNARDAWGE